MLQRAARNAYSWWWASHIRTKQSKWLEQNLHDMEEKVEYILKIINEDGDSFRTRAEQYYRKRPEIVNFVEDCFRGYRALAERYDHLSRDLQSANRTIATVYPERVQMSLDEEDFEDFTRSLSETNQLPAKALPLPLPDAPKPSGFPKMENVVQAVLKKKSKMPSRLMSKKGLIKLGINENATKISKSSGLTKSQALEEIDKLQKSILGLQTEKEFVKSSYENGLSKYWEIENKVTEMQAKVNDLQEEFGVGTVIEDNDAKTLMSSTALKSCQEALAKLQEKQKRYKEEASIEYKRIEEARKKFETLIEQKSSSSNLKNLEQTVEKFDKKERKIEESERNGAWIQENPKLENLVKQKVQKTGEEFIDSRKFKEFGQKEAESVEAQRARIREELLADSGPIAVSELAEKIDELVDKVISLETEVSCQTALVMRLRVETDELHSQLQNLEEDKEMLVEGSKIKNEKIKKLEAELEKVSRLDQKVKSQDENLETSFREASVNLDNLSENLLTAKPDEETEEDILFKEPDVLKAEAGKRSESRKGDRLDDPLNVKVKPTSEENRRKGFNEYEHSKASAENFSVGSHKQSLRDEDSLEDYPGKRFRKQIDKEGREKIMDDLGGDLPLQIRARDVVDADSESSNNAKLGNNSSPVPIDEDRLRLGGHGRELTKKVTDEEPEFLPLNEEDQPNWRRIFSLKLEDREKRLLEEYTAILKNYKEVRKKLSEVENRNRATSFTSAVQIKVLRNSNASKDAQIKSLNEKLKLIQSDSELHKAPDAINEERVEESVERKQVKEDANEEMKISVDEPPELTDIEEKIRMDIDDLLEENIEFWLRFSTSYNQIKKFQDSFHDLLEDIKEVREKKRESGSSKHRQQSSPSNASDIRPLYRHLRDMQTELTLWLQNNDVLRDDLRHRLSSLSNIQEEISKLTTEGPKDEEKVTALSKYQAAKFQGEVLNMKQENAKVADELRVAAERVRRLHIDIEKTLAKMDEEIDKTKNPTSNSRIPLRSFLFGVKLKKHKPSFFACMSPALQRQYSDLSSLPPSR